MLDEFEDVVRMGRARVNTAWASTREVQAGRPQANDFRFYEATPDGLPSWALEIL